MSACYYEPPSLKYRFLLYFTYFTQPELVSLALTLCRRKLLLKKTKSKENQRKRKRTFKITTKYLTSAVGLTPPIHTHTPAMLGMRLQADAQEPHLKKQRTLHMEGLSTMTNSLFGVLDYEQSLSSSENARVYEFSWRQRTRKRARKSPATRDLDAEGDVEGDLPERDEGLLVVC